MGSASWAHPMRRPGSRPCWSVPPVDLMVFSPERLDYVAGARIAKNAPFYQDRGEPRLIAGGILDLDAFPDVTPEERHDYQTRLAAAQGRPLLPQRFQTVKAAVEQTHPISRRRRWRPSSSTASSSRRRAISLTTSSCTSFTGRRRWPSKTSMRTTMASGWPILRSPPIATAPMPSFTGGMATG